MSTSPSTTAVSGNVLVVVVGAVFCFAVACAVAIFVAVPEDANPGSLAAILLASLSATVTTLANLYKTNAVEQKVDQVHEKTEQLTNGLMDSKIRAGVADVLTDELLDQGATEQLVADRARRTTHDAANGGGTTL